MTNHDRPPVPPLSEGSVSRIERGVFAALDREERATSPRRPPARSRWRATFAMTAAAAGAFAVAFVAVRGLHRGDGLPARGARIATAGSPSHLTIPGASIDVAPASAIDFAAEHDGTVVIRLERGAVTCEVAPRPHRAPFVVEAGATRVTVIGTRFTVTRAGEHAGVYVVHGTVEVGDGGMTQLVHAGERFRPGGDDRPGTVDPATPAAALEAPSPAAPTPTPATATATATAPTPTQAPAPSPLPPPPPSSPAPAPATAPARRATTAPPGHRRAKPEPSLALATPALPAPRARPIAEPAAPPAAAAGGGTPSPAPAAAAPPAELAAPPEPAPDRRAVTSAAVRQRFAAAAGLEVRDPAGALRIYSELSAGDGAWAANALFAQARLEGERGQPARARALLAAYLRRFPHGANADDARALIDNLGAAADAPR